MTTPDTLSSLIAKWRKQCPGEPETFCDDYWRGFTVKGQACANELEAALDALVEKWDGIAVQYEAMCRDNLADHDEFEGKAMMLRSCVAELRERGAIDKP